MTMHASQACCETSPAAFADDYASKGTYETYSNIRCYVTGPRNAKKAIYYIYDVFGFQSPTVRGADILSSGGHLVVMPDFFDGKPMKPEWFARDTDLNRLDIANFRKGIADPKPYIEKVHVVLGELKEAFPTVDKWGAIGYCFGGRIVAVTSGKGTPWSAALQISPFRLDAEDAKKVSIPMGLLASKDEPADAVMAFYEALSTPKSVETFHTQVHGWMSARADLKIPEVKKEYERGYQVTLDFFAEHL
ncbi:hypothetical protein LTR85_008982 [Meristemomyces frigidus]|nr:hypothetical protein LTR85_008982 [Meristemomyces frigidus]